MTIDPEVWKFIGLLLINVPVWYVMRANLKKQESGAYSELVTALRTSGQTIDDLFTQLSEVPALKNELDQIKRDWKDDNQGAWANHDKLVEVKVPPPYVPTKRYTEKGVIVVQPQKKKQSGFGGTR